jgi:hypothetical protein
MPSKRWMLFCISPYNTFKTMYLLDVRGSVHHDIIYVNNQQDETV